MTLLAGTAFVDIIPNTKDFVGRLTKDMSKRKKAIAVGGALVGGAIVAGMATQLKAGLDDALKEQVSTKALENSLLNAKKAAKTTGAAFGVTTEAVTKLAGEIESQTGIADDAVIASASWLGTFHSLTRDQPTFDRAQKAVVDLSAKMAIASGSTIDLAGAQNMVGKALQDPIKGLSALSRVGVTFSEAQKKTIQKMVETGNVAGAQKEIMKGIESQVKGAAKAYGETLPGKVERAHAAWGNMREELSVHLIPALTKLADKGLKVTRWLEKHPKTVKALAIAFGALAAVMITASVATAVAAVVGASKTIKAYIATSKAAIKSAWAQVKAFASTAASAVASAARQVAAFVVMAAKWAWMAAKALASAARVALAWLIALGPIGLLIAAVALAAVLIVKYWDKIKAAFLKGVDKLKAAIKAGLNWIKTNWKTLIPLLLGPVGIAVALVIKHWDKIKKAASSVWSWTKDKFTALVDFFRGVPGKIAKATVGMFDGIKNAFRSAINWVISKWNSLSFSLPAVDTKIPKIGKIGGFTLSTPNIPMLADGGTLSPGQLGIVGERGPEFAVGGMRGTSIIPMAGKNGGRMSMTITNWEEGTGYIEVLAGQAVTAGAAHEARTRRMRR